MTHSHDTATPALSVESEYVLLPKEATAEMLTEGVLAGTFPWTFVIPPGVDEDKYILAAIYRAMIAAAPAPNPSPAAKGGEAKLSDAELAEAISDAEIDFGRWQAGEIKRVYGIESRMAALDAEAKRRGWVDGEKPALATPSPQPADAVREAIAEPEAPFHG